MNKVYIGGDLYIVDPYNGHEFVDLGLPSGNLWATLDIGSTDPKVAGDKFRWGEVEPSSYEGWSDYKWGVKDAVTKYNEEDGKVVLDAEDDAAHVLWGGKWKMPTRRDFEELLKNCTWYKDRIGSSMQAYGFEVVGGNGNSIYLPTQKLLNPVMWYWSSTLSEKSKNQGVCINNNTGSQVQNISDGYDRIRLMNIRPIIKKSSV